MEDKLTLEEYERILDSYRACGDCICDICNKKYYQHPMWMPSAKGTQWNEPYLHELCNGDLVKL